MPLKESQADLQTSEQLWFLHPSSSSTTANMASNTLRTLSFFAVLAASSVQADLISSLFPLGQPSASWSTADGSNNQYPLSDDTLKPQHLISALPHDYAPVEGKDTMEATFPEGTWGLSGDHRGGLSFYSAGPSEVDLTTAKEATFGYSVFFQEGWEWNKGGKLPGLCTCPPLCPSSSNLFIR
jgi:hypothetical protein